MRKSTLKILLEVYDSMDAKSNYSIRQVAAQTKCTWRTAKACLFVLCKLGVCAATLTSYECSESNRKRRLYFKY